MFMFLSSYIFFPRLLITAAAAAAAAAIMQWRERTRLRIFFFSFFCAGQWWPCLYRTAFLSIHVMLLLGILFLCLHSVSLLQFCNIWFRHCPLDYEEGEREAQAQHRCSTFFYVSCTKHGDFLLFTHPRMLANFSFLLFPYCTQQKDYCFCDFHFFPSMLTTCLCEFWVSFFLHFSKYIAI